MGGTLEYIVRPLGIFSGWICVSDSVTNLICQFNPLALWKICDASFFASSVGATWINASTLGASKSRSYILEDMLSSMSSRSATIRRSLRLSAPITPINLSSLARMSPALSSAIVPCRLSNKRPPRVTNPTANMAIFLPVQKWCHHLISGTVDLLPRNNGNSAGRSGQHVSIMTSSKMPTNNIVFPLSLHNLAAASATSKSWFIPDSTWTIDDYVSADRRAQWAGEIAIVLIFIVWAIRIGRRRDRF